MSKRKVVLVFPDASLALEGTQYLAGHYNVETCRSARELTDLLDLGEPDVAVVPVLLPDANGLEFCLHLKSDPHTENIKTIVLSSYRRPGGFSEQAKTKYRVDGYLEMPARPEDWVGVVRAAVAGVPFTQGLAPVRPTPAPPPPDDHDDAAAPDAPAPGDPFAAEPHSAAEEEDTAEALRGLEDDFAREIDAAVVGPADPIASRISVPSSEPAPAAAPDVRRDPDVTGKLGPVLLPELLLRFYREHAAGVLDVRALDERREMLLRDGVPVAIRSNFIRDDSLGQLLVSRGLLDPVALEHALSAAKKSGRLLGEVLIERGILSHSDLLALLAAQAKRKMNSAFRWKEGTFAFTRGIRKLADAVPLDQDMLSIIIAGVGRHYDMAKLEERLYANKNDVIVQCDFAEIEAADLGLTEREWRVRDLADGKHTLGEIIADADLSFARTFQVIYLMLLFGVIAFEAGDRFLRVEDAVAHRARAERSRGGVADEEAAIDEGLPTAGRLEEVPLGRFLMHLFDSKSAGRLTLRGDGVEEIVVIDRGMPVQVLSSGPGALAVGEILVRRGRLTSGQRDQALAGAREQGRQIGEEMIAGGLLSPHELFETLMEQLEHKLLALFAWPRGSYQFEEGDPNGIAAMPMELDLARLVLRGIRENVTEMTVAEEMNAYLDFAAKTTAADLDLQRLFADPREQRLVSLIDGRRTVKTLVEMTPLDRGRSLAILFALRQIDLVQLSENR
jgi:CheY-like chemotaxis protein